MGVDNARAPWRWVLVVAALASGRAFVVGCGGHVLFRAVLHHFLPLLRRHMRLLRHKQQQPRPPPSPLLSFASSVQPTAALLEIDKRPPHETDGDEGEDGLQETDGPATPLPATDVNDDDQDDAERTARGAGSLGWWLWDGSQNRESLRLGAFLASMTGGFRVVEFALQRLRGTDDGWNSFLAGAVAGLSIAIDTRLPRQQAVALYVFFKACGMVWSSLTTRGLLPRGAAASGGRWTVAQHGIWCLLCGVIMYCFFCEGELLDSFVYRFLYNCTSTVDQYAMSYVRKYALGMADEDPEAKAQERRDYASGKLRALPPPVVVKRREHFALMRSTATGTGTARAGERVE